MTKCATCKREIKPMEMAWGRQGDTRSWCEPCGIPADDRGWLRRLVHWVALRTSHWLRDLAVWNEREATRF